MMMNHMNDSTPPSDAHNELATQNEFGSSHEFMLSAPKKKISTQTVVLVAVLVIGCGLLFGMRKMGMGPALSFAEFKIDYEPRTTEEAARAEMDRVLAALDLANEPIKLPMGSITRNPFALDIATPAAGVQLTTTSGPTPEELAALNAAQRLQKIELAFSSLRVHSIMGGRIPLAKINNATYTVGDSVTEWFQIAAIEGRTVTLTADGEEYQLTLGGNTVGGRNFHK